MKWDLLASRILDGGILEFEEALMVLESGDDDLLKVLDAAFRIRSCYFGRKVSLHVIRNAKSGICSENCSFCSQSTLSESDIPRYPLLSVEEIYNGAKKAHEMMAKRYCIVTSGRGPSDKDINHICNAVRRIKAEVPIQICTSLGLLAEGQARQLKDAGVDRYNHNLESSERFYSSFCTSHSYRDRFQTAWFAKSAGLELCSGGIIGMGESFEDRVSMAFELKDIDADSIPVNFLNPRPGTPMEGHTKLTSGDCLRALAMFRFVNPTKEIRVAGGRESCFGAMQALALYAADSIFTTGYLTTAGQGYDADISMINQAGFTVGDYIE